jgi:predicted nucleotidyltransferase
MNGGAADQIRAALAALMRCFDESQIDGAIIGGVAASLRGAPRMTKDVDALVVDADAEHLLRAVAPFGFAARSDDAIEFARQTHVLVLRHTSTAIDFDLLIGALPFEAEVVARAGELAVGGITVRVATAEDLVIMKTVAGRARDAGDIENLLKANPGMDLDRVRQWVREFSSALDRPDIQENLERVIRTSRSAR